MTEHSEATGRKKILLRIEPNLLERITADAKRRGVTTTALINFLLSSFYDEKRD